VRSLAEQAVAWGGAGYDDRWAALARDGLAHGVVDTRLHGRRYVSLNAVVLTDGEARALRRLTGQFGHLFDRAVEGLLADSDWWPLLAWPWPALELARQEPCHPGGLATLYGRFDWLLDERGRWQVIEYNADTPSGGREASGLEAAVYRLHDGRAAGLRRLSPGLAGAVAGSLATRVQQHRASSPTGARPLIGVVSSHAWVEDMAQAWWLAGLLRAQGLNTLVGDVRDLAVQGRQVSLRGAAIDALYRFYPIERLYRHGISAPLLEAALDGHLLLLNGLRGFLAQSKAVLAWLWEHRADTALGLRARRLIEAHLPPTFPAADARAGLLLPRAVVKHVNGREGDSVAFGGALSARDWERRLIEGGYVVQQRVNSQAVADVEVDEQAGTVAVVAPRYPCVGTFCVGGQFGGCYTRLGGRITTARATFVATLAERWPDARGPIAAE